MKFNTFWLDPGHECSATCDKTREWVIIDNVEVLIKHGEIVDSKWKSGLAIHC